MPKSPELRRLLKLKRQHEAALLQRPGVVGVSLGYRKRSKDAGIHVLTRSSADAQGLPKAIQGASVSAKCVGEIFAGAAHRRIRPLKGGSSISKDGLNSFGSLGGIVTDSAGSALALTCFHVLAGPVCALSTSANILQPAQFGGGHEIVASVARFAFTPGLDATGVDAAVGKVPKEIPSSFTVREIGPIFGMASAALGDRVEKFGIGSQHTYGVVTDIAATLAITYEFGTYDFYNHIVIEATSPSVIASTSGDSGALWINASSKVVGLNYAFNSDHSIAFAQPIRTVADQLGFAIQSFASAENDRTFHVRAE